jgi:hypothetical protein
MRAAIITIIMVIVKDDRATLNLAQAYQCFSGVMLA